jgi:hypothetical protein
MTPFTTFIHADTFRLVTFFRQAEKNVWQHIETPYKVFSDALYMGRDLCDDHRHGFRPAVRREG